MRAALPAQGDFGRIAQQSLRLRFACATFESAPSSFFVSKNFSSGHLKAAVDLAKMFERPRFHKSHALRGDVGATRYFVGRQLVVEVHAKHGALAWFQSVDCF